MTEIRNFFANLFFARQTAGDGGTAPAPFAGASKDEGTGSPAPAERTIRDTVTLSEGGQKILNLARGQELAKEIRAAPADENFKDILSKALDDIYRIIRLFTESVKAAFQQQRKW